MGAGRAERETTVGVPRNGAIAWEMTPAAPLVMRCRGTLRLPLLFLCHVTPVARANRKKRSGTRVPTPDSRYPERRGFGSVSYAEIDLCDANAMSRHHLFVWSGEFLRAHPEGRFNIAAPNTFMVHK